MNCSEARALLNLLTDGALETKDTALVVEHTKECNECAQEWSDAENLRDQFKRWREDVTLPAGRMGKIKELIDKEDSAIRKRDWPAQFKRPMPLMLVAAAVAIVGLICLTPNFRMTGPVNQTVAASALIDELSRSTSAPSVENREALPGILGYEPKYIQLPGWSMQRAGVYDGVAAGKIARFDFSRPTSAGAERMSCYQARTGTISMPDAATIKTVGHKRAGFGRRNSYNFALWSQNGRDYLVISSLPQEALEALIEKA